MPEALANAFPRKHFFLEMFSRDISLEDCILDLVDNSIDSLVRRRAIDPAKNILRPRSGARFNRKLPTITISLSREEISIADNCGGIPLDLVMDEVFSFGHDPKAQLGQLGAYGIGLKRAIFKIAEEFEIESTTEEGGFRTHLNVTEWAEKDRKPDDWKIPIEITSNGRPKEGFGTTIRFWHLRQEVKMRLGDGTFIGRLMTSIAQTYCLFLED